MRQQPQNAGKPEKENRQAPSQSRQSRLVKVQNFFARNGVFFLITIFMAACIHVIFVFAIPHYLSKTAFDRIKTSVPLNNELVTSASHLSGETAQNLPSEPSAQPSTPAQEVTSAQEATSAQEVTSAPAATGLNFDREPMAFFSVCRYDLTDHALNISVTLGTDSLLALTFHDSLGNSYQAMSDEGLTQDRLDITLSLANHDTSTYNQDNEDDTPHALQITSPTAEGFVLFSITPKREAGQSDAQEVAKSISCTKAAG